MPRRFGPQTISSEAEEACAQEPIRVIGTVQPHGFVVVVDITTSRILQVSTGIARHWPGLETPAQLIGAYAADWIYGIGSNPAHLLATLPDSSPILLPLLPREAMQSGSSSPAACQFECVGHRVGTMAVLEWQAFVGGLPAPDPTDYMVSAAAALFRLRDAYSLEAFYQDCVREVSKLCGFDRVMLYRFLPDWTGEVLAEEVVGDAQPLFLGLRFPASDIPAQARALYTESKIRVLADVSAVPDRLVPGLLPDGKPLDQSHSSLRGFSDVHRTYLGNMGVRATMSLSIVCGGKLWGLIACHHNEPRNSAFPLRIALRQVCELMAAAIALRIEALEQMAHARETLLLDQLFIQLQQGVVQEEDTKAVLHRMLPQLLSALQAGALCVRIGDWCYVGGTTVAAGIADNVVLDEIAAVLAERPAAVSVLEIGDLLVPGNDVMLDSLPLAAGLLAVRQPETPHELCAFIRPEIRREVSWAGEPVKSVVPEAGGRVRLEPRRSFSLWKENVGGTARAWSSTEVWAGQRLLRILSAASRGHRERAEEQTIRDRARLEHLSRIQRANLALEREVAERVRAEDALQRMNDTLEIRVAERTLQFEAVNLQLVEEGERFAVAADAAGIGFWDLDFATGLVDWDERMFRLFARSPVQGKSIESVWIDSLHPDDRERCKLEYAAIRGEHRSYDSEYRIVHPNGAIRHLKSAGRVRRDVEGEPGRLLGVTFDITESARADEQFRHAIEAAPTGMLLMNRAGSIVLVNAQIEALFGYPRAELLNQSIEVLIPERFRISQPNFQDRFYSIPRIGGTEGAPLYGVRKDGSEVPIDIRVNPLQTSEGEFVLSSIVDLTNRLEVDRLRNEFVSTVSHELRTPLTSITGALGLLESGTVGTLPDTAATMVAIAYKNSRRLSRLINDILDTGALEAGKAQLRMVRVQLDELVRQSVEANLSYADKYEVRFVLAGEWGVHEVRGDPDRLVQVLTNLLSNAAKFSPPNADVLVRIQTIAAKVRVEIEDSGPGIAEGFKPRIFQQFAQADSSASRRFEGTGLGLNIAKKLIEAMDGTIGFTTRAGEGSTFHIELPLLESSLVEQQPVDVPQAAIPAQLVPAYEEITAKDMPRLLYVEDDFDMITVLRVTLEGRASIVGARSIREAEELLRNEIFDLIILDQSLPDGNGICLVDRIPHTLGGSVPVIVLSATDIPNDMHRKVSAALAKTQVSAAQVATTLLSYLPTLH